MDEHYEIDLSKEIDVSNAGFLGCGSFGDVHLVEIHGRQIVVKTLRCRPNTQKYDSLLTAIKKECDTLVELDHLNIIGTIGGSEKVRKDGLLQFGILTEYCEIGTLKEVIFNPKVFYSMKNVTIWSENLFDALDHMFKTKQIIHRDIKLGNIFVTKNFIVKLGDFGTTKEIVQTCTGTLNVGTSRYLSPPQLDSNKTSKELSKESSMSSSRDDVYALGLVIWQLIERRRVYSEYENEGKFNLQYFITDVVCGNLKGLDPPKCLREFQEIVESCCNFNRSKRPYTEETLKQLQEFNKINNLNDFNDGYPKIDENQQEVIRPIGFDDLENRELIPVTSNYPVSNELEIDLSNAKMLGCGSFAEVHLVEIDGRRIAVRTLRRRWITRFDGNFDLLPDFQEECQNLLQLDHPNIIKTIGGSEKVRRHGLLQFGILTEWCELGTLKKLIFDVNVLYSMKNVFIWSENLFDALDYMFKTKQIIHRDIKPEHIFVKKDFTVKLGDFGTTKEIDQSGSGTWDVGTMRYLSPPQLDANKTHEELLDQGKTDSSRNDVYALGLVIWQLIERRLVYSEYGNEGKFDHTRFIIDVVRGELRGLEPPKCLWEFQEIVESCCNFDRSKRPNIEETLKWLQEFKKINNLNDSNDGYPKIDENQQELIRPIGFDHFKSREVFPVTSPFEISENKGRMLMENYQSSWTKNLREEFMKRFDEMSNHEKMDFTKQIEDINVDAINKNYKYFHEYSRENLETDLDQMDIRQIFEGIVLAHQSLEMEILRRHLEKRSKNLMKMSESTKCLPWLLFSGMKEVAELYNVAKVDIPFSNFKFKCFFSLRRGEEWILIDEPGNGDCSSYDFLSKSLDKYLNLEKEQLAENQSVFYSDDDELHYLDDFIIKRTEFFQLLERAKLKLQTKMNQDFCLSKIQQSEITQEIVKDLPIEGYLFQLTHPPRIQCNHQPKCDVKMQVSNDGHLKIPYYSCSSERQNNYLSNWMEFLVALGTPDWNRYNLPIQEQPNSDPIVLLQVIDSNCSPIEYITILDFSDEYFNEPKAPYLDSKHYLHFMDGRILHKFFVETPENQRKYLVATPNEARLKWNLSVLDQEK